MCRELFAAISCTLLIASFVHSHDRVPCDVRAWTESGWVCGLRRWSEYGKIYASFRGVPYAKQPVGELRFKELQPLEPWKGDYDAREEGPVCPQHDEIYGIITTQEYGMSEACIHANIHVPLHALPNNDKNNENDLTSEKRFEESKQILSNNNKDEDILYNILNFQRNVEEKSFYAIPSKHGNNEEKTLPKAINNQNDIDDSVLPKQHEIDKDKKDYQSIYQSAEKQFHEFVKNLEERHQYTDSPISWPKQSNQAKNDKGKSTENGPKEDEMGNAPYILPNYVSAGNDQPMYILPNNNNHHTKGGVQYILETWPKWNKQEHPKGSTNPSLPVRNTRSSEKQVEKKKDDEKKLLPILVFIHGGGFNAGSGDADLHGPEYLVSRDVIVITFNYRIGLFGYLSLNTSSVPGNNGLRDQIHLLRWVQRNAKNFGGDPNDVTLMGQSTGASCAHLLSLSDKTKGLFKRVFLMSGTAYQAFYTTSPIYTATVTASFLSILGITSVDPEEIHQVLVKTSIKRIVEANSLLQAQYGLITFTPVVESKFPDVERVLDKDPETLIAEGRGKEYPFVIGCTTNEGETFRRRLGYERYVSRIIANPRMILPVGIVFSTPPKLSLELGIKVKDRCFGDVMDKLDGVVRCYGEAAFVYQAFRLAREKARMDAAPTYLYQFTYEGDLNLIQKGLRIEYNGTAHIEDLTYVFRTNSLLDENSGLQLQPSDRDYAMKDWMNSFVINFMHCSDPTCHKGSDKPGWPLVAKDELLYEEIDTPYEYRAKKPNHKQQDIIEFYDTIYKLSENPAANETPVFKDLSESSKS